MTPILQLLKKNNAVKKKILILHSNFRNKNYYEQYSTRN
jgi:hypothetical protein